MYKAFQEKTKSYTMLILFAEIFNLGPVHIDLAINFTQQSQTFTCLGKWPT